KSSPPANEIVTQPAADTVAVSRGYVFPYDLSVPVEKFKLPDALTEISGIDVYKKSKLVCVQDEKGKVYVYDVKKGELKEEVDFGAKGDYEGVANVNDTIWVLSSDGNLHRITGFNTNQQQTEELKTPLNEDNDTEGLCYDQTGKRLLIACKDKPGASMKGVRAVYSFDLKTNSISTIPAYTIKIDQIKSFLAQHEKEKFVTNELKSLLDPKNGDVTFQPSEIHVHPITNEIYILSSAGNLLLVLSRNNTIQFITTLDPGLFKQPEGITFMEDGTMFISDEGRDGHGNILKFNYQPNAK
ncbi:MAG TPA: SdiA-regulated domain-containing protein, partial [Cyclobacteriaceae bacterium]|nr:SdiA-regulated domain-containing protein [Cyclobacteriaceae bacterium]